MDGRKWLAAAGSSFKPDHLVVTSDRLDDPEARRAGISVAPDHAAELHNSRTPLPAAAGYDRWLAGDEGAEVDGGVGVQRQARVTTRTAAAIRRAFERRGRSPDVTAVQDGR